VVPRPVHPFFTFALYNSFSTIPGLLRLVLKFYNPGLIFDGFRTVVFVFHVLRSHTHFDGSEGVAFNFQVLCRLTHFQRSQGCYVRFSYFVLMHSFLTVTGALHLILKFCTFELFSNVFEGVVSVVHVLRCITHFR
jgi:hypothetical protein